MDHLGRVHDKINYNYGRTNSFSSYEQQYLIEEYSCIGIKVHHTMCINVPSSHFAQTITVRNDHTKLHWYFNLMLHVYAQPLRGWSCMGKHIYLVPLDYLLM